MLRIETGRPGRVPGVATPRGALLLFLVAIDVIFCTAKIGFIEVVPTQVGSTQVGPSQIGQA